MTAKNPLARIAKQFEAGLAASATAIYRWPILSLVLIGLMVAFSIKSTGERLRISADLTELLPKTFPSVQALDVLKNRMGGIGYVAVAIRGAQPETLKKLVEDLKPHIEALRGVKYVDYKRPRDFFKEHALYYADIEDLEELRDYVVKREAYERQQNDPLFVAPDSEKEPPPEKSLDEIRKKHEEGKSGDYLQTMMGEAYYIDPDQNLILLLAKPTGLSSDLNFTNTLVTQIKEVVSKIDTASYGENIQIEFGGNYTKKLDQQALMQTDIEATTWIAILLVLGYVAFHFRRLAAVVMIMGPLLVGLIWTATFAAWVFGMLNILTASIGAILLGLGIDHGIHLLGRFESEWDGEKSAEQIVALTFGNTGKAVVMAGITTTVAFGGLSISEFRAFHEFGIIAAGGMTLMVLAYLTLLPALISLAIRLGWQPRLRARTKPSSLAGLLAQYARPITYAGVVLTMLAYWSSQSASFNGDSRTLVSSDLPSFKMDGDVDRLLGHASTPVLALTHNSDEEQAIATALKAKIEEMGDASPIDLVAASADMVPKNQAAKALIIEDIRKVTKKIRSSWVEKDQRKKLREFKKMTRAQPFTHADLPKEIRRKFEDAQGVATGYVLIFSRYNLSVQDNLNDFADAIRSVRLPNGEPLRIAGEHMILADIFNMVVRESWPVIGFTFALVLIALFCLMGNIPAALLAIVPACFTMLCVFALVPVSPININYMNVCMLPALFGMSVDGGVHLVARVREGDSLSAVVDETGRAIVAALVTTALGFLALTLANHRGIQMLGHLSVAGLAVNLIACLVLFPALLHLMADKIVRKTREA